MGDIDARLQSLPDLGPALDQRLFRRRVPVDVLHPPPQIPFPINQAGHYSPAGDGTPAVSGPLGSMDQVHPKILVRIAPAVGGHLREPRTGNHDGGGAHQADLHAFDRGQVGGVAHPGVIAVNNQQLVRGQVP